MLSRTHKKVERHCPTCETIVTANTQEALRYIFAYTPFHCENCGVDFEIHSLTKIVMLLMASMVIYLALKMEALRALQSTEPNLELYLLAGTVFVTVVAAFVVSRNRNFVVRDTRNIGSVLLHYATLVAMPGSLLLFAYMAGLFAA